MKTYRIGLLVMLIAILAAACTPAQTPTAAPTAAAPTLVPPTAVVTTPATDPAAVVTAFNNALNAGNVDAAMALVADDAVMDRGPYGVRTGKAAIRDALQIETSKKLKYEVSNFQVSANKVNYSWKITNLSGHVFTGNSESIVQDGKIRSDH